MTADNLGRIKMEETKVETKSALDHATSVYGEHAGIWVYVGTYHKYNCGSIEGRWLCLNDFLDEDQFLSACKELHKDEEDPELMYQDYEGPKAFYSESRLDSKVWNSSRLMTVIKKQCKRTLKIAS
jgi:antirestriction protein